MIVLMLTKGEVEALLARRADQALKQYLAAELRQESLLPDDNLPQSVTLEQLESCERGYIAVVRTYSDPEAADRAWGGE